MERSRSTDKHVQAILKITTAQQIQLNFEDLVNEKRCQVSLKKKIIYSILIFYLNNVKKKKFFYIHIYFLTRLYILYIIILYVLICL